MNAEELAEFYHEAYQRHCFWYKEVRVPWSSVTGETRRALIAAAADVLKKLRTERVLDGRE